MAGTNSQNFSFLNRFSVFLQFDYMTAAVEAALLTKKFPQFKILNKEGKEVGFFALCEVTKASRDSFKAGNLSAPLTTRDAISWARKLSIMKLPLKTAEYSFLNRMRPDEAMTIASYIALQFGLSELDRKSRFIKGNAQVVAP